MNKIILPNQQPTIEQHMNIAFLVKCEKQGKQETKVMAVPDMQSMIQLVQALTMGAVTKRPCDEIRHPLFGYTVLGFQLTVENITEKMEHENYDEKNKIEQSPGTENKKTCDKGRLKLAH